MIADQVHPGLTELTRMPSAARSMAIERVSWAMAALLAG